jgi:hypothetical protein
MTRTSKWAAKLPVTVCESLNNERKHMRISCLACRLGHHRPASLHLDAVAASLVTLHVTPHTESLATTGL